ncbi:HAD hydrolase-like protein [Thermoactinomyces sp. DSM 45892]|uniref:5' nucleotidase, NT5C type n=1 Tax=Thermoactinomyces sp. DSM 45892 TaxID=1882753 RepID=UPI0008977059|nr:HAD hydrolase-like protein [Thermoactinomyces sp. DSM 45892]SDY30361.1 hypothetical protein SAMN05444416_103224 [Thermoactinomyces sp. DSM 45892]
MKLGVDIDGTIKDTKQAAVTVYNEEFHKEIRAEDLTEFYLDRAYGLTPEEGRKTWRRLEEKIYRLGVPLPHAREVLQQLSQEGHEIYYVTARPGLPNIQDVTKNWLRENDFPYQSDRLIMSSIDKAKVALKLGIDLFFEDAPNHLDRLIEQKVHTMIVDAPYNRQYSKEVPRITDWRQVYEYISKL